jgi:prepilin-type N-terminal cleavage/methylation domain-containing protein
MLLNNKQFSHGFTLIEMVVVMLILGILANSLAQLTSLSFRVYREVERNANLTYLADTVLQQMARDIRLAVPNSTRITRNDTIVALEFHKSIHPVSYVCNLTTGEITHHTNYSPSPIQKTVLPAGNLLVNQVSACDFTIAPATRGELIKLIITLTDNRSDAGITLFQQFVIQQ